MAVVNRITGSEYQVTMTGTELALIKSALGEAERASRFGIEVLDGTDRNRNGQSEQRRLHQRIDALAMREASLRSLRKTMSEVDNGAKPTPSHRAALDGLRFRPLRVPQPRWSPDA